MNKEQMIKVQHTPEDSLGERRGSLFSHDPSVAALLCLLTLPPLLSPLHTSTPSLSMLTLPSILSPLHTSPPSLFTPSTTHILPQERIKVFNLLYYPFLNWLGLLNPTCVFCPYSLSLSMFPHQVVYFLICVPRFSIHLILFYAARTYFCLFFSVFMFILWF